MEGIRLQTDGEIGIGLGERSDRFERLEDRQGSSVLTVKTES